MMKIIKKKKTSKKSFEPDSNQRPKDDCTSQMMRSYSLPLYQLSYRRRHKSNNFFNIIHKERKKIKSVRNFILRNLRLGSVFVFFPSYCKENKKSSSFTRRNLRQLNNYLWEMCREVVIKSVGGTGVVGDEYTPPPPPPAE